MLSTEAPSSTLIFCQGFRKTGAACRNILGSIVNGVIVIKHGGREIVGAQVIRCEHCGSEWRAPD